MIMPVYARKTTVEDQFGDRRTPDGSIQYGRCGCDLADTIQNTDGALFLLYTDQKHLTNNVPYDVYCQNCLTTSFPKAIIV
jgi:hypothetical protein